MGLEFVPEKSAPPRALQISAESKSNAYAAVAKCCSRPLQRAGIPFELRAADHFCRVCFPSITSFNGSSAAPISNWNVAESGETCLNVNRPRAAFPSILPSLFQVHVPPSALPRAVIYTLHASLESLTAVPART